MNTIEIKSKTDTHGHLRIDYQLDKPEKSVRVLIMLADEVEDGDDEQLWLKSISNNPAFDFLAEEAENIYSASDGEPFRD